MMAGSVAGGQGAYRCVASNKYGSKSVKGYSASGYSGLPYKSSGGVLQRAYGKLYSISRANEKYGLSTDFKDLMKDIYSIPRNADFIELPKRGMTLDEMLKGKAKKCSLCGDESGRCGCYSLN